MKLEIQEQPFQTPSGEILEGIELVVSCPMNLSKVNVKKNCAKCFKKRKLSLKDKYVDCKFGEK